MRLIVADPLRAPALPEAPAALAESIGKAKARTLSRRHGPVVGLVQGDAGKFEWDWPFSDAGDADWKWLVLDAFGTRYANVATCFVNHLIPLCQNNYDEEADAWVPEAAELSTMLHIISAHRPRDEAQAALAAQIAATHLLTLKVAKRVADYTHDTRMISAFAKLARASAAQIETMVALKGTRRTARQQITVTHEKHIHHHQHVHVGGGADHEEGQPDASRRRTSVRKSRAAQTEERPALPGAQEDGGAVSVQGRAR